MAAEPGWKRAGIWLERVCLCLASVAVGATWHFVGAAVVLVLTLASYHKGMRDERRRSRRPRAVSGRNPHRWVLISDDDEDETEMCIDCGALRDRHGPLAERATKTGGFRFEDCARATVAEIFARRWS